MADRLNDTDPQSPVALQSRTDPGLGVSLPIAHAGVAHAGVAHAGVAHTSATHGEAKAQDEAQVSPLPPTPVPGSASIEELLDGITGPRPPPSSRRDGAEAGRLYAAARPAPPKHPTPPIEQAVFSPDPQSISEREATTVPRASVEPRSLRPVMRRGEERTVYTGRRALVRNSVAVILSAAAVTAMMMGIMRWKEEHSPHAAMAPIVLSPLPAAPDVAPAGPSPTIVIVSPPPPTAVASASAPVPGPSASASAQVVPAIAPRRPVVKRVKAPPPGGSLDDLNREISH